MSIAQRHALAGRDKTRLHCVSTPEQRRHKEGQETENKQSERDRKGNRKEGRQSRKEKGRGRGAGEAERQEKKGDRRVVGGQKE